jgi:predicted metal-dependent HD superfamily phosphohydrolase
MYRRKRLEILHSFLNRPAIYATEHFRDRYEIRARENLEWAIQGLSK